MRKILCGIVMAMLICIFSAACGKKESLGQETEQEEAQTDKTEIAVDFVDEEVMKQEGYKNLADIAYAKAENGILYLVYFDNETESALYLAGILMTELEGNRNLVITWEGLEYEISEEKADGNEESFWKLFPEDWHETINKAMSGSGIQYLVSKGTADKIDKAVEEFIQSQGANNGYGETQESSQEESSIDVIDKFEWEYDENNNFALGLTKDKESGILSISALGCYSDGNIGLAQNDYMIIFALSYSCGIESNILFGVGEESYILSMNDGKIIMNTFPSEIVEDVPETYIDSAKQMMNSLDDFYVKNGLKEKTYNELVYEDENVKIFFTGISGKEDDYKINFTIENLSSKTLQVSDKDTSINGYMADPLFVVTIAPGKKAKDGMSMSYSRADGFPMSGIKSIETKFHVSNEDDWKDYYDTENVIVLSEE